ncbi:MAG: hypothetical protein KC483_02180 [Nitrosarchaeum sp.]|nr:hypothetical protein [Nitrosarchaeum sp.]MCA9820582.1 hypothetical protein [Nitrosarchaeum sp.]
MQETEKIQEIIDEVNQRAVKDYQKMEIEEISHELRDVMTFEQEYFERIDDLEKKGAASELAKYAKMICRNSAEREITIIQEIYLSKIDSKYLKSK